MQAFKRDKMIIQDNASVSSDLGLQKKSPDPDISICCPILELFEVASFPKSHSI